MTLTACKNGQEQCTNKQTDETELDYKCRVLCQKLEQYEMNIHQCERLYERQLTRFEFETVNITSLHQIGHLDQLIYYVKIYVHQHIKLFLRQVRYKESCCHMKLVRQHRRCHRQPRRFNSILDAYPQITINVPNVSLNPQQLDYLSRTGEFYEFEYTKTNHLNF